MSLKTLLHSLGNPGQQPEPYTVADPCPHFTEGQPEDGRAPSLPLPQLDFTLELPSHWPLPGPPAQPLDYYGVTSRGTSPRATWRSWSASAECWVLGHQEITRSCLFVPNTETGQVAEECPQSSARGT